VHGYRDGASWKFKPDEIERVAAELSGAAEADAASKGVSDASDSGDDALDELIDVADLQLDSDEDNESILVRPRSTKHRA
jgi:hypothetical protein